MHFDNEDENCNTIAVNRARRNKSFSVDTRINVALDPELAVALGELILSSNSENTALVALGHQLVKVFGES